MKIEWTKRCGKNILLYSQDKIFFISYNSTNNVVMPTSWQFDNGSDETVLYSDGEHFILNGDFRSDYEKIIDKGFDTCMQFYLSKRDKHISSHSSDFDEYIKEDK